MNARAPAPAESVLILHGQVGPNAAADDLDTIVQVQAIRAALQVLGFQVAELELGPDLSEFAHGLDLLRPHCAFNLVEQIDGRDALLPLAGYLFERAGIPYTGAPAAALAMTTDKIVSKRLMNAAGIPTPDWHGPNGGPAALRPGEARCWIVKSVTEHASFGLSAASVVATEQVASRIRHCTEEHGGSWFAERYVDGREFNVSLLAAQDGPQVLPIAEIEFVDFPDEAPAIVDYAAKWKPDSVAYRDTPRRFMSTSERVLAETLGEIALRCWKLFGLRGYARVDFRVDSDGRPWVLEVNANPCLSPDAGFVAAAAEAQISFPAVIARIVSDAGIALPEPQTAGIR